MRLLSKDFIQAYPERIVNIHPSLLPAFTGFGNSAAHYGVKITGCTVHLVDQGLDTGPILSSGRSKSRLKARLESLAVKIHTQEHQLYPEVLQKLKTGLWSRSAGHLDGQNTPPQ